MRITRFVEAALCGLAMVGAIPAEAGQQAAPAAGVCGASSYCYDANNFTATVTTFRVSTNNVYKQKIIDVTVRFQNKTTQAVVLAYVDHSGLATDDRGLCVFETVKPGRVPGVTGRMQAPHINVSIYAPGLLRRVVTRIYFAGDPANDSDQVLELVPEDRRPTLLTRPGGEAGEWCFDLHLTGPCETVFFDV